ncbi:outer membrane beta-barrel protein [Flavobacterium sp.]|uniref:outer membrane beta-barrel protein n=1 Tax=Flavobacterium sp. TaxID=239 RepID=UPI003752C646
MKKIILTVAAVFAFGFANAQDKKEDSGAGFSNGDAYISGSFGINSTNDKNTDIKTNGFDISPTVGYFFTDNIALGARIGFSSDKTDNSGTTTSDDSTLSAGLFGRYYFTPASQFSVFTELGADYVTAKDKISNVKANGFGVNVSLGLNYFVSDNFAIEATYAGLNYASAKVDLPGAKNVSAFSLGGNLSSVSIGLLYKF